MTRTRAARLLVRVVARCWDRSFRRHAMVEQGLTRYGGRPWSWLGRKLTPLLKVAGWLDREAAGEQMANEGWWG